MGISFNVPLREEQIAEKRKGDAEREKAESISSAIQNETTDRQNADATLQADIAALNTALSDEVTLRANDDYELRQDYSAKISQETITREQADNALRNSLQVESATRQSQATSLSSAIQNETTARQNADATLQANFAALNTALSNEITLRASDDYSLKQEYTQKISQEKTAREQADATLKSALQNESSTRQTQATSLGSALQNEITTRTSADTALKAELNANLSNEATLRAAEDNKLNQKIEALKESIPQQTLNIKEFTPSSATKDGEAGLVPAPAKGTTKKVLTDQGWEELSSTDIFIGAVPSQSGQPSYNGNVIYPQWLNYDEQKLTIAGQTSGTNAGTYTVTFTPRGLYCWSDGTRDARSVTWQIYKATVPIPTAAVTSYEYTGSNVTLSVTNYNSSVMTQAGTVTAKNAGSYTATYKLKSTANYTWSDGTTADKNIAWNITAKKIAKPYASNTTINFTGSTVSLSVSNVDLTLMNKTGSDTATAAGNYSVTFTLKDTTNYKWSDNSTAAVKIDWKVVVVDFDKPSVSTTSFEFTGSAISLSITGFDAANMTKTGTDSAIDAGTYTVTFALKDKVNTKWKDGTTADVVITWTINRKKLTAAQSTFSQKNAWTYDKTSKNIANNLNGYDSTYHDLSSQTSATNAGTYTVKVTPKANYAWSDGTTAAKSVSWKIDPKTVKKPELEKSSFEYDGTNKSVSFVIEEPTLMSYTGTTSEKAIGSYPVTFKLNDITNYKWTDGTTKDVVLTWTITAGSIEKPKLTGTTEFTYSGATKSVTVEGYDSSTMTFSGTISAINAGTYTAKYSLKDKTNTKWSDGTTADVTLTWTINRKNLTAAQSTFSQKNTLTYDGSPKNIADNLNGYNATYHDLSSQTSMTNAGTYTAKVTPKDNYNWSDGTRAAKSVSWKIDPQKVTKPTAAKTAFEYDGAVKELSLTGYNSAIMTMTGTSSASAKGSYSVTFKLNNKTNYTWADDSTTDVVITWTIGAKSLEKPKLTGTTEFTFDGNSKTVTVSGYDSDTMTFSGTVSATNAGKYTATYSLKDKSNYTWSDGTTGDVILRWTINRKNLTAAQSTLSCNASEIVVSVKAISNSMTAYIDKDKVNAAITGLNTTYHKALLYSNYNESYISSINHHLIDLPYDDHISVTPTDNYCWNDGTVDAKIFPITTKPLKLPKPSASETSFKYDGVAKELTISNYDSQYMTLTGNISGTNVGSYSATYALRTEINNTAIVNQSTKRYILWEDDTTDDVTINWKITTNGIAKPTLVKTEYEWTGGTITAQIDGFDNNTMTFNGTSFATDIGTYTRVVGLQDRNNTQWDDGTTDNVYLTWKIVRQKLTSDLAIDTGTTLTYSGNVQEPTFTYGSVKWTLANLSQYFDVSSQTAAVDAGTYNIVVTPKSTYAWKDGSTAAKTFSWTINQVAVGFPVLDNARRDFKYDGQEHSPYMEYDDTLLEQIGTDTAIDAGRYYAILALRDEVNYKPSSSYSVVNDRKCYKISWRINKAKQTISVDKTEVTIKNPDSSATINVTYSGEGWRFETVDNPNGFMNHISGGGTQLTINVNWFGEGKITVQAPETTNYAASGEIEITVHSQWVKALANCGWEDVQAIAASGYAANGWTAGDYKTFVMQIPKVDANQNLTNNSEWYRAVLLGIDHNSEDTGHYADFMILDSKGKALRFDYYRDDTNLTNKSVTYNGTEVTSFTCNGALSAMKRYLPSALKSVMRDARKTAWNTSPGNIPVNNAVTLMFDLSPGEIRRGADNGNTAPYDYFLNGNGIPTPVTFWTRVFTSITNNALENKGLVCIYDTVAFVEKPALAPRHGVPCFRI